MSNYTRVFAQGHTYFITITTEKRRPILIDNITLLRQAFSHSKQYFKYEIDSISIMPDHLHMILYPEDANEYPNIIKSIKTYFSKNINQRFKTTQSQNKKQELGIWQRRYYEHTIRNETELERYRNYIHYNPVKHKLATSAKNWEFSSFGKFVKNGFYNVEWYNLDEDLDFD
jgi:putative transposase